MFALDTNTIIYLFRDLGNVRARMSAVPPTEIALPSVVLYELEIGTRQSNNPLRRRLQLEELLTDIEVLPFDGGAAIRSAEIGSALSRRGMSIGQMDTLIAGIALRHGATVVTHNASEFQRVPGLALDDWL